MTENENDDEATAAAFDRYAEELMLEAAEYRRKAETIRKGNIYRQMFRAYARKPDDHH